MTFREKLKTLRKAKGMSQQEVAEKADISLRAYISYEKEGIRPKRKETYKKLAEVLECDTEYLEEDVARPTTGFMAGLSFIALGAAMINPMAGALAGTALVAEGARRTTEKKTKENLSYNNDMLLEYEKKQKQFRATALGIIVMALAQKGITCQIGNRSDLNGERSFPDDYLVITDQKISAWWLVFWARDKEVDRHAYVSISERADIMFSRFVTAKADPERKASIVVDDKELFEEICELKENNSYRGNISAILVDKENARIEREELLGSFDINDTEDKLGII